MICKNCGKKFNSILSDYCPYCGTDNSFEDDSNFTFLMLADAIEEDLDNDSFDEFDEETNEDDDI